MVVIALVCMVYFGNSNRNKQSIITQSKWVPLSRSLGKHMEAVYFQVMPMLQKLYITLISNADSQWPANWTHTCDTGCKLITTSNLFYRNSMQCFNRFWNAICCCITMPQLTNHPLATMCNLINIDRYHLTILTQTRHLPDYIYFSYGNFSQWVYQFTVVWNISIILSVNSDLCHLMDSLNPCDIAVGQHVWVLS